MANPYTDLLSSLSEGSPTGSTNPYSGFSWSPYDLSSNTIPLDHLAPYLKELGYTGPLYDQTTLQGAGVNGDAYENRTSQALQDWLKSNNYTLSGSQGADAGKKTGTAYDAIRDAQGNIVGNPVGRSFDDSKHWMDYAVPGILGAMAGGALGVAAGGTAGGAAAGDAASYAAAADAAGGLLPEFGTTAAYNSAIGAVPATAATTGFMGPAEAVGTTSAANALAPAVNAASGATPGTTFGIPNNLLGTGIAAGSQLLGGVLQNNANKDALDAQMRAAAESNALLKYMYDTQRSDQAPWMEAGKAALGNLTNLLNSGELTSKFAGKFDPAAVQMDPGYQFGLDQGQKAIQNSAAARGMGLSGAALKDAARFGNDYATTKYDDAYKRSYGRYQDDFNRFYAEKSNTLNPLFQLSGLGQNATNQVQQAGTNYANNASNNAIGLGNASAANAVNRGNIYGNMLANLGGLGYNYFNP